MAHAAMHYLVSHQQTGAPMRFDVIEITADGVLHVPNAFMAN